MTKTIEERVKELEQNVALLSAIVKEQTDGLRMLAKIRAIEAGWSDLAIEAALGSEQRE